MDDDVSSSMIKRTWAEDHLFVGHKEKKPGVVAISEEMLGKNEAEYHSELQYDARLRSISGNQAR